MPHPTDWPRFADSLREGRLHPFTDYVPGPVAQPPCDVDVRPGDGTRHAGDHRSMFLLASTAPMPADTPIGRIKKAAHEHFNAVFGVLALESEGRPEAVNRNGSGQRATDETHGETGHRQTKSKQNKW